MKRILAAALFCAMGFTACDTTTGTNDVVISDAVLLDTLDNHGTVDSSNAYSKTGNQLALTLSGYDLSFNVSNPAVWSASFPVDTMGATGTVIVTQNSVKLIGGSGVEQAVYRATSLTLSASIILNPLLPAYTKDTTITPGTDSAYYWLMLPSTQKLYLGGNASILSNLKATMMAMLAQ